MKPDFSGTWTFDPARSRLQIPAPDSTVFVVEHREPELRITRTHRAAGRIDTFSIDLVTDGREIVVEHGDLQLVCRAAWDGDALVFATRIRRGTEAATNDVRYTLAEGVGRLVAEEKFRSAALNYDNRWVLARTA